MASEKISDMTVAELKAFAHGNGYEIPKDKKLKKDILSFVAANIINNGAEVKASLSSIARNRIISRRRHLRGRR